MTLFSRISSTSLLIIGALSLYTCALLKGRIPDAPLSSDGQPLLSAPSPPSLHYLHTHFHSLSLPFSAISSFSLRYLFLLSFTISIHTFPPLLPLYPVPLPSLSILSWYLSPSFIFLHSLPFFLSPSLSLTHTHTRARPPTTHIHTHTHTASLLSFLFLSSLSCY